MRLAEPDHVIWFSQSHVLFTTTGSKQDVRLAEADRVIWFSLSHGYYTLLLLCLLREQVLAYYVETPYCAAISVHGRIILCTELGAYLVAYSFKILS